MSDIKGSNPHTIAQEMLFVLICDNYVSANKLATLTKGSVFSWISNRMMILLNLKKYQAIKYVLNSISKNKLEYHGIEEFNEACLKYFIQIKDETSFRTLQSLLLPYDDVLLKVLFTQPFILTSKIMINFIIKHLHVINNYEDDMAVITAALSSPLRNDNVKILIKCGIIPEIIEQVAKTL